MPESHALKRSRDLRVVLLALFCSAVLALLVGGGAFFWNELEQTRRDNAALAAQVRSLGGQPVAEGKPGERGEQGPRGEQGIQGPPGIQGPRGPIGITGQSPACLLEPTRCVGPKGATGNQGVQGTQGPQGDPGATGETGPQGPAGPQGDPGTAGAAGPQGETGPAGKDGRGIKSVDCQANGEWLITYSDDTTSTTDGPCRFVVPPVEPGN